MNCLICKSTEHWTKDHHDTTPTPQVPTQGQADEQLSNAASDMETRLLFYINSTRGQFNDAVTRYTLDLITTSQNARKNLQR